MARRREYDVGPLGGAVIGFVITWIVVSFVLRIGMVNDGRVVVPTLIVSSTAIALLVAARARRNGNSA